MAAVNFYLKPAEQSTGRSLIFLRFVFDGKQVITFSFGETINGEKIKQGKEYKYWNKEKQRPKDSLMRTAKGDRFLKDLLNDLENVCLNGYREESAKNNANPKSIRLHLERYMKGGEPTSPEGPKETKSQFFDLVERFCIGEIKHQGLDKKPATLTKYRAIRDHLKRFEAKEKYTLTFESINLEFLYKYIDYLKKTDMITRKGKIITRKGLGPNTISKHVTIIKTFMSEAADLDLTNNLSFKKKKFTAAWQPTDAVYLNDQEIIKLYKHQFENEKHRQVVDMFTFLCYTGLRYGDGISVGPENIVTIDGTLFVKLRTEKTNDLAIIPLNTTVLEIFDKYQDRPSRLPKMISNQKFNNYIKEACELAGFTETGRLSTDNKKPLFECVSAHTARRSFATNLYLQGFPIIELMKLTGHKTEKIFLNYIKISKQDAGMKLSKHMQLRWNQQLLKAV
jgi:integrase